jgi:hypothetical protein
VCGRFWHLYLFEDIFSRKAIGGEVFEVASGRHAADLLQHSVELECANKNQLVLHTDNGAPMKSSTLLTKMVELGITSSRGRAHGGNDKTILAVRHAVYETAKTNRPERWSGTTRNWQPIGDAMLNPEKNHRC